MHFLNIFLIAVALSFDAVAVSAANGANQSKIKLLRILQTAFCFGIFHFFMPLIGWLIGNGLQQIISKLDHWVAFSLLVTLGLKMIFEAFKSPEKKQIDINNFKVLLLMSVAISIDALVVGMTFALLPINIWLAATIISSTTFLLSIFSIYIGKKCGEFWGKRAEIAGGVILIIIGLKILIEHYKILT